VVVGSAKKLSGRLQAMSESDKDGQYGIRKASMQARVRLLRIIGEELISDEPVAVVELAKNSYDADASWVKVRFTGPIGSRPSSISISDDGHGMDEPTIKKAWLEPGTSYKRTKSVSPLKGRKLQGAKGIGRFAAARLGERMLLETTSPEADTTITLLIDWGSLDDEMLLDDIEVEYEVAKRQEGIIGTTITLEGIRREWTSDDYELLKSRLERLVSPFGEVSDFKILLSSEATGFKDTEVEPPEILLKPKYLLDIDLDAEGLATGSISIDGKDVRNLVAEELPGLPKPAKKKADEVKEQPADDEAEGSGPFKLQVRAWDRDQAGLDPLAKQLNLTIAEVRSVLNNFCGVSIYRDGFRVYPYGQRGDDWLNLDVRSRLNPALRLSNNQIVGAIRISRDANPSLEDRSSREGMIRNRAHADLESKVKRALMVLEEERYKSRPRAANDPHGRAEPMFELFDLQPTISKLQAEFGHGHASIRLVQEAETQIKQGVERIQDIYSRLLASAGLGHLIDLVIHEIGAPLGKIVRQIGLLEKAVKDLPVGSREAVRRDLEKVLGWCAQINSLRDRLDPNTPAKRGKRVEFNVYDEINGTIDLFEAVIRKQEVTVSVNPPTGEILVKMPQSALSQVLANLMDNALYWLSKAHGIAGGGEILIETGTLPAGFYVRVQDDGAGVADDAKDLIFEPYYTRKESGMGLGLYIARLVIEPYGRLVLDEASTLGGASFTASFEGGVGRE
jgi:signal transduction histidine kinase